MRVKRRRGGAAYNLAVLFLLVVGAAALAAPLIATRSPTAQDIGSYKPDPRNFAALDAEVARLGVPRERHVHVAQSLFHDHVPAKAAGLPTVWINRRHANPGRGATPTPTADVSPDWTFPSMTAFADAMGA